MVQLLYDNHLDTLCAQTKLEDFVAYNLAAESIISY